MIVADHEQLLVVGPVFNKDSYTRGYNIVVIVLKKFGHYIENNYLCERDLLSYAETLHHSRLQRRR